MGCSGKKVSQVIFYFILLYHALLYSSPLHSTPHHATSCTSLPHPTIPILPPHQGTCTTSATTYCKTFFTSSKHHLNYFNLFKRGHILIGTPGRLEDLFTRKHEGFDLAAHVRCLVRIVCWAFSNYALTYSFVLKLLLNEASEAKKSLFSCSVPRSSAC